MARAQDKTVLVVDDEPNVRDYLAQILRDAGFNVVTASDGAAALEIIQKERPDFISLDLVMPKKSGHKLLYELRKDKELSRIPVLIVTAHAQDELGQNDLQDILENSVVSGAVISGPASTWKNRSGHWTTYAAFRGHWGSRKRRTMQNEPACRRN